MSTELEILKNPLPAWVGPIKEERRSETAKKGGVFRIETPNLIYRTKANALINNKQNSSMPSCVFSPGHSVARNSPSC